MVTPTAYLRPRPNGKNVSRSQTDAAATKAGGGTPGPTSRLVRAVASVLASVLQFLLRLPVVTGRLGMALGRTTTRATMATRQAARQAASRAGATGRDLADAASDLSFEAPVVTTPSARRQRRRRILGLGALVAAVSAALGAVATALWRRRAAEAEATSELDALAQATRARAAAATSHAATPSAADASADDPSDHAEPAPAYSAAGQEFGSHLAGRGANGTIDLTAGER